MQSFSAFLRFVAARQQQGLVAAFGRQLVSDEIPYEAQEYYFRQY